MSVYWLLDGQPLDIFELYKDLKGYDEQLKLK